MMKSNVIHAVLFFTLTLSAAVFADERVDLEGATIIGNRELPKVLYVVPWKLPDQEHVISRPLIRQIHNDLSPVERTKFQQILDLQELRQGENQ